MGIFESDPTSEVHEVHHEVHRHIVYLVLGLCVCSDPHDFAITGFPPSEASEEQQNEGWHRKSLNRGN
jgi:hypothetical protein